MNGGQINEGSHVVEGESDQTTQGESALAMGDINHCSHSDIAFQNISLIGDEMENILHSHASSSAENIGNTQAILHSDTSDVVTY